MEWSDRTIHYAIFNVLALTYLHKPIISIWTYEEFRALSIIDLLSDPFTNSIGVNDDDEHYEEGE